MFLLCLNCPEWLQDIAFTVVPDPLDHFIKMLHRITKNLNKLRSSWDHTGWAISYMWTIAEINFWWQSSSKVYVGVTLKHWDNFFLFCTFYKRFDVFPALQPAWLWDSWNYASNCPYLLYICCIVLTVNKTFPSLDTFCWVWTSWSYFAIILSCNAVQAEDKKGEWWWLLKNL